MSMHREAELPSGNHTVIFHAFICHRIHPITHHLHIHPSTLLFISPPAYLTFHPAIHPSVQLFILPCIYPPNHSAIHPPICSFVQPSNHPSNHPSFYPVIRPSILLSIVHPLMYLSVHHSSIYPFIYLSFFRHRQPLSTCMHASLTER